MPNEKNDPTPPVVNTPICSSFSAACGDQVTFSGAAVDKEIKQVAGQEWPFCGANGAVLGPPIRFTASVAIYIKAGLTVGQGYPYIPTQCADLAQKTVTITEAAQLKRAS